jgi:hypothetical protein
MRSGSARSAAPESASHVRFRIEHLDELVAACEQPVTSEVIPIQRSRTRSKL